MNIIIVGCGKVGYTIAKHLSQETNNITVIDKKSDAFDKIVSSIDVMAVRGNGLTRETLSEASVKSADLIISVTNSDETNILCCVTAKKLGAKSTVARVRDPEYYRDLCDLRKDLGVDLIINPEQQAAMEISRLLRFPSARDIETFADGKVELVAFKIDENSPLAGKKIMDSFGKIKIPVLAAQIQRGDEMIIPHGQGVISPGDIVRVIGKPSNIMDLFRHLGINHQRVRNVTIIGGGKITYYLAAYLLHHRMDVKIIEKDDGRCYKLNEALPDAVIINGDGTDEELLLSEGIDSADGVVCLTDRDEENIITGLYSKNCGVSKVVIKINYINLGLVKNLDIGSTVCPKNITAYQIIRYVRALSNSAGVSGIKTMYKLTSLDSENDIEALEFEVYQNSRCIGKKLKELSIKSSVLVGCITRSSGVIIPNGDSRIEEGDAVIVLSKGANIKELDDILLESPLAGVIKN